MLGGIIAVVVVGVILILWFVLTYNGLITWRTRVRDAWAQIDVQLKRRHDLIPNLVNTVKGYMQHEREVLENVTKARQQAVDVSGIADVAQAENVLSQALRQLFAVAENYPDLKANQNMLALQEELTSTENKISYARQFYNDAVMTYNVKIQKIPANIVAGMFSFQREEFFEIEDEAEREVPAVEF
ncbi:MAG: LemA family protein [Armatimonadota bacterium]